MKKTLLVSGLLASVLFANAQTRLSLYEEFSGENCGPCAAYNPGLWTLLTTGTNPNKVMLIKYQSPIPTAGPIWFQNTTDVQARLTYYNVPFAPYARMDGILPAGTDGNIADLTQAHINTATAIAAPFNITVTNTVTGTTLNSSINVAAVAAYAGTAVKLRAALVETLIYPTPPGTNGETEFHHVVRKMYPSADGQTIPNTWTNGQTATYTISGQIPSYVDRTHELFVVVWIQNDDATKTVAQAAKSVNLPLPASDGAITASSPVNGSLFCTAGTQVHKVTLKNTGTTAMTSADIYYKVGSGAFQMYAWTGGNLAPNATIDVTVGNITLANGTNAIVDSIGKVNTQTEINPANSVYSSALVGYATPTALPLASSFENGLSSGWAILDNDNKAVSNPAFRGETWSTFTATDIFAFDGSWTAVVSNADMTVGNKTTLILPLANIPAGPKALDFYYANAMRTTIGDKLEIVSSTDCGQNWTPIWTKANADLANNPATAATALLVPSSAANYRFVSVDMSALTANALIGFRSTSGGGNYIWLDKVNMRTGAVTGIEELVSGANASLYPNPVIDQVTIELNMVKAAKVSFQIVNMLGQQVGQTEIKNLTSGQTRTTLATSQLSAGVYFLNIVTDKGNLQQKFVKK
jgi:hypothetical protein